MSWALRFGFGLRLGLFSEPFDMGSTHSPEALPLCSGFRLGRQGQVLDLGFKLGPEASVLCLGLRLRPLF